MLYCSFYYFFVSQLKGCKLKFVNCICFFSFVPKQIESLRTNSMFFQHKDVVVLRVLNGFQAGNCCFEPEYVWVLLSFTEFMCVIIFVLIYQLSGEGKFCKESDMFAKQALVWNAVQVLSIWKQACVRKVYMLAMVMMIFLLFIVPSCYRTAIMDRRLKEVSIWY